MVYLDSAVSIDVIWMSWMKSSVDGFFNSFSPEWCIKEWGSVPRLGALYHGTPSQPVPGFNQYPLSHRAQDESNSTEISVKVTVSIYRPSCPKLHILPQLQCLSCDPCDSVMRLIGESRIQL